MDSLGLIHIRLCSSISPSRGMSQSNSAARLMRLNRHPFWSPSQRSRQAEEGHEVGSPVLLEPSKASLNGVARTERSAAKD